MTLKRISILSAFFIFTLSLSAQVNDGSSLNIEYSFGNGQWNPYSRIIREYNQSFPWLTDTSVISDKKYGISFGTGAVGEKGGTASFRFGGFKSTGWSDGLAPTGEQWNMTFLVKCQFYDAAVGYFFIHSTWFRMGISTGLSLNVVKLRQTRAYEAFKKAKESKMVFIMPSASTTTLEKKRFFALKFSLPVAIGRKHAFCFEPFYCLPLYRTNTLELRKVLLPNSTPAHPDDYYKGKMTYAGMRISFCLGVKL